MATKLLKVGDHVRLTASRHAAFGMRAFGLYPKETACLVSWVGEQNFQDSLPNIRLTNVPGGPNPDTQQEHGHQHVDKVSKPIIILRTNGI